MMTSDMYDSDDACKLSPPLVPTNVNYGEDKQSPPPFVPEKDAGSSPPNLPHIAEHARHSPLEPFPAERKRNQPQDFDTRLLKPPSRPIERKEPEPGASKGSSTVAASTGTVGAGTTTPATDPAGASTTEITKLEEGKPQFTQLPPIPSMQVPSMQVEVKSEFGPKGRLHSFSEMSRRSSQDIKSPELKPRLSFPSLQPIHSPERSCLAKSPDSSGNSQTLPSIHKALSELSDFGPPTVNTMSSPYPFSSCPGSTTSGNDSPFDRFPSKFPIAASPYSHISPVSMKDSSTNPSPASHSSFWRGPSEMISAQTPFEASPMAATSPATNYPTPTEQVGAGMDRVSLAPPQNGGPVGSYKCTHPGCTAAPFQTQYLLNSHANVHSQDRPHFCPVDGCPRALGGKGFKRKNEMMRHGLVHNSPGYVCPFCPDQQHKYPRPDNLQRHVRVHHVDKNKDDPILRQVLAQRPMGSARGRKRRMNNT